MGEKHPMIWGLSPTNGDALHTDDKMAFVLKPSREAYLYLMQQTASGEITMLFPDSRISPANPVASGMTVRIPNESVFRVNDKDIGTEKVFIVASLNPITNAEQAAHTLGKAQVSSATTQESREIPNDNTKASSCKTRALELEAPASACVRTRGIELDVPSSSSKSADTPSMRVKTEAADTTIVQVFQFDHLK